MPYYGPRVERRKPYDPTQDLVKAFQRIENKPYREAREELMQTRAAIGQRKAMEYGVYPEGEEPPRRSDLERPSARTGTSRDAPMPTGRERPGAMEVDPESFSPVSAGSAGGRFADALDAAARQQTGQTAATQTPGRRTPGGSRPAPEDRGLPPGDVRAPMGTPGRQSFSSPTGMLRDTFTRGVRSRERAGTNVVPSEDDMGELGYGYPRRFPPGGGQEGRDPIGLVGGYRYFPQEMERGGGMNPVEQVYQALQEAGHDPTWSQAYSIAADHLNASDLYGDERENRPDFVPTRQQLEAAGVPQEQISANEGSPWGKYELWMEHTSRDPDTGGAGAWDEGPDYVRALNTAARYVTEQGMTTSDAIERAEQEHGVTVSAGDVGLAVQRSVRGRREPYAGGLPTTELQAWGQRAFASGELEPQEIVANLEWINNQRRRVQRAASESGRSRDEVINELAQKYDLSSTMQSLLAEDPLQPDQLQETIDYITRPQLDMQDVLFRSLMNPRGRYGGTTGAGEGGGG